MHEPRSVVITGAWRGLGLAATIVLQDADLSQACLMGIAPCMHAGRGCAIPTRLLLPRSRYAEGVAILEGTP